MRGAGLRGLPTGVGPLGLKLGEAKAVPPVVTAVYRLIDGVVEPYAGGGVAVMFTTDAHGTNPKLLEVAEPTMSIAPAPGLVLQGGLDAKIVNHVYARLDVKFIAGMFARARRACSGEDARPSAVRYRRSRHRQVEHVGQPADHSGGWRVFTENTVVLARRPHVSTVLPTVRTTLLPTPTPDGHREPGGNDADERSGA